MPADVSSFLARRRRVADAIRAGGGGVAIVPTAPEQRRNGDNDHPYRHGSDFHYLTGFAEPAAWLIVAADGRSTLVCRPKDVEREIWDGVRLGPDAAAAVLGVDAAFALDALDETMVASLADQPAVWWTFETPRLGERIAGWLERIRSHIRSGAEAPTMQRDLGPVLAEMRLHKDAGAARALRHRRDRKSVV